SSGAGTTCWRSAQPAPTTADHLPKVSWSVTRSAAHGITPVSACAGMLRHGTAFVREELQSPAPPALRGSGLPAVIIIVGGGAAGHAAAETLRQEGYAGAVTLLSADAAPPCDRPN